jgi:hypothetical protein
MRTTIAALQYLTALSVGCSFAPAQTHSASKAWVYGTTTVSNLQFSGVTVAGTGGNPTHTMAQIAILVRSPKGRTASAYDHPIGTQGKATAYLPLCGGGECEDGEFFFSTENTTERCPHTDEAAAVHAPPGGERMMDPSRIPDELAYTALFHVIRTAPPPHWDWETCREWLVNKGVDAVSAQRLIGIAGRYFPIHDQVEGELLAFNERVRNSLSESAQAERSRLEARRAAALRDAMKAVKEAMDSPAAGKQLAVLIQDIKNHMKVQGN